VRAWFVTKRLAFGSAVSTWGHVEKLQALGITHVVNLRHGKHGKKVRQFESLWLPFEDDLEPRPRWFYKRALRFYRKAMRRRNAKVFVMCHHGYRRSPSLVYFLLRASGANHFQAQRAIHRVRPGAVICRPYRESGEIFLALEWANRNLARAERRKSKAGART
jgi:protein-tyrosine phosphatase